MKQLRLLSLIPIVAMTTVLCAPAPDAAESIRERRGLVTQGVTTIDAETGELRTRLLTVTESEPPPMRILSFRIPEFRPEHADDRRYYVVEFNEGPAEVRPGAVNREGLLTASFPDLSAAAPQRAPQDAERLSWFYSVHHDSGQLLFTLDLADVALPALVDSLAMALKTSPAEQLRSPPGLGNTARSTPAERVRLKIRGDQMTLRETLDLIHQQTGCRVFREQGRLLTTVCE